MPSMRYTAGDLVERLPWKISMVWGSTSIGTGRCLEEAISNFFKTQDFLAIHDEQVGWDILRSIEGDQTWDLAQNVTNWVDFIAEGTDCAHLSWRFSKNMAGEDLRVGRLSLPISWSFSSIDPEELWCFLGLRHLISHSNYNEFKRQNGFVAVLNFPPSLP